MTGGYNRYDVPRGQGWDLHLAMDRIMANGEDAIVVDENQKTASNLFHIDVYADGTRGLADSYRAELVRAARQGLDFDPATGEPAVWAVRKPPATSWYRHAVAYAAVKWPHLAPHSRASLADGLGR